MTEDRYFESLDAKAERELREELLWIRGAAEDTDLLFRNAEPICKTIERGLRVQSLYFETVAAIVGLLPTVVKLKQCDVWFGRISAAVVARPGAGHSLFHEAFRQVIPAFHRLAGVYADLDILSDADTAALLETYIDLFRTLVYNHGLTVIQEKIDQAFHIATKVKDRRLVAKFNQTLALYYIHYGDVILAERYAKVANTAYELMDDPERIADACCTLAIIYRTDKKPQRADHYIKRAYRMMKDKGMTKQFATILYEEAVRAYRLDIYDLAMDFLNDALAIYEEYQAAFQIAMVHQVMAMIYIHTDRLRLAEVELRDIRRMWEAIGNPFELVNVRYVEGDLELRRGNRTLALRIFDECLQMARALPETPARDALIVSIQEYIADHS